MNDSVKRYGMMGIAGILIVYAAMTMFGGSADTQSLADANTMTYICGETEEVFQIPMEEEMAVGGLTNPKTGKDTLWPAEICYWNECGPKGTAVLMNEYRLRTEGKKASKAKPTECPNCGHIVRFHNPLPPEMKSTGPAN